MRETLKYAGLTHVGRVRSNNEDAFALPENGQVPFFCVLADGMGGHSKGELASDLAVSFVYDRLLSEIGENGNLADVPVFLSEVVQKANDRIYLESLEQKDAIGMGTTLTVLYLDEKDVWLAHVGDCRAYLLRSNSLSQLTTDQTVAQEMLEAGSLTPEELPDHPRRNVLTQALGMPEFLQPEIVHLERHKNDCYLLCSDGLYSRIQDETLQEILQACTEPKDAVTALVKLALDRGGEDNVTVLVIST